MRFGVMKIPDGYDDLYGFMPEGGLLNADIGSKLMLTRSDTKSGTKEWQMAMLELVAGPRVTKP